MKIAWPKEYLKYKDYLKYVVIVLIISLGVKLYHIKKDYDKKQAQLNTPILLNIDDLSHVTKGKFEIRVPISGELYPLTQTTVIAKVSGEVKKVNVREGQSVKALDVLARLDTSELEQTLMEKQAGLEGNKASYELSVISTKRYKKLLKQQYYSQNDYDASLSQQKVDAANVKQSQAALNEAQLQLDYATIISSITGIITERKIDPGVNVSVGATLFKIVNLDKLELKAVVPADEITKVKINQHTEFLVEGISQEFSGKVVRINPSNVSGTRAFYAYIDVDNQKHTLKDGMFATGGIVVEQHNNALSIPYDAISKDSKGSYVFEIKDNKVVKTYITLGLDDRANNLAEVIDGLEESSLIIVSNLNLESGTVVQLPEDLNKNNQ